MVTKHQYTLHQRHVNIDFTVIPNHHLASASLCLAAQPLFRFACSERTLSPLMFGKPRLNSALTFGHV